MCRYFVFLLVFSYPTFPPKKEEESACYLTGPEIRRAWVPQERLLFWFLLANTRGGCSRILAKFTTQFCRLTCEVLNTWKETDKQLCIRFYSNKSQTLKVFKFNKGDIFTTRTVLLHDSTNQKWTCEQSPTLGDRYTAEPDRTSWWLDGCSKWFPGHI